MQKEVLTRLFFFKRNTEKKFGFSLGSQLHNNFNTTAHCLIKRI